MDKIILNDYTSHRLGSLINGIEGIRFELQELKDMIVEDVISNNAQNCIELRNQFIEKEEDLNKWLNQRIYKMAIIKIGI